MKNQELRANFLLLLAAVIWGGGLIAQKIGAQYVGAFTFNGIRFAIGALVLLPVLLWRSRSSKPEQPDEPAQPKTAWSLAAVRGGAIMGVFIFVAASLQQTGVAYTTVGKAAFITGLYMAIVPLLGIFLKQKLQLKTWLGVVLALLGLYLLSVTEQFTIGKGDLFVLVGALFWALHILIIDHFTKKIDALLLAFVQFVTCATLSLTAAALWETVSLTLIYQGLLAILYGGLLSTGTASTMQVLAQKHAKPSHTAIILSLETVFAAILGYIILKEYLDLRELTGCALMLTGTLITQLRRPQKAPAGQTAQSD